MESIVDREWKKYQGYVRRTANTVAAQFAGRVDPDDLGQAGLVALLEVCERFDPTRAETFGAYVRLRVRGAIFDAAREETKRPPQPSRSAPPSPTSRQKRRRPSPADRLRRVPLGALERGNLDTYEGRELMATAWSGGRRSIESEMLLRELVRSLRRRLSELRPRERQAVQAYDLEGLSFAAAGRRLGLSPAGVLMARRRGLARLRESFA